MLLSCLEKKKDDTYSLKELFTLIVKDKAKVDPLVKAATKPIDFEQELRKLNKADVNEVDIKKIPGALESLTT